MTEIESAKEWMREQQGAVAGALRVSAPLSLGIRFLPGAIARFRAQFPEVDLKLNLTDRFVDMLGEEFDMALRISGPPADKSTIWRKICVVPRLLVAAPAYLQRAGAPKAPEDLARHSCLGYSHFVGGDLWTLREAVTGETRSAQVRLPFECDNGDVVADLAKLGEGIALLPRFIVARHLETGALTPVLAGWRPPEIWLTAFYPPYEIAPREGRRLHPRHRTGGRRGPVDGGGRLNRSPGGQRSPARAVRAPRGGRGVENAAGGSAGADPATQAGAAARPRRRKSILFRRSQSPIGAGLFSLPEFFLDSGRCLRPY